MDFFQILNDVTLWVAIQNGLTKTLAHFQKLAILRWDWIVQNQTRLGIDVSLDSSDEMQSLRNDIDIYIKNNHNPLRDKKKFTQYLPFLNTIQVNNLGVLSQKEQEIIDSRTKDISELTEPDFRKMYNDIKKIISKATQYVNLHDADSKFYNETVREHVFSDLEQISAATELEEVIEQILFDFKTTQELEPNKIENAINNLNPSSEVTLTNNYKSAVAVPFEKSLAHMAERYLGSQERWLELTAANNLFPPYEDFVGEKIRLTSNAVGKTLQIPIVYRDRIKVGQKIQIFSSINKKPESIIVDSIEEIEDTITVTVNRDVSIYKKRDLSYIRVFKQNTIQKDSFILIPSTVAINNNDKEYESQVYQRLDKTLRAFGTDFSVGGNDDWEIEDDIKITYGIPAVKQAVNERLKTASSENKWHFDYGISDSIGTRFIGFDQANALALTVRDSILKDTRFSRVVVNNIVNTDISITINLTVFLHGISRGIPLSFVG